MGSAISGADARRVSPSLGFSALLAAAVLLVTCAPPETENPAPQAPLEPELRIGLVTGGGIVRLQSDQPLTLTGSDGVLLTGAPPATVWSIVPVADSIRAVAFSGWRSPPQSEITVAPTSPAVSVSVNGRPYRGRILIRRDRTGLTIINRVGMESYLAGVVSAEMGRRDPADQEALTAQAVVSRTFAIRNLGKRRQEGFDLYATVVDQVYGGVVAETAQSWQAVRESAGLVLTWQGTPIDAFFYSTCGGRTTEGSEVFAGASRPYLRSVRDQDDGGQAYCSISPRFHWHEEWTGSQLRTIFQRALPLAELSWPSGAAEVLSVRVTQRTGSDRVSEIEIVTDRGPVTVSGPAVRQVLHPNPDPMLRSSAFVLNQTSEGGHLVLLTADGSGSGHGVGFCQWGAVGRSRAGQRYPDILAAYYAGARLERLY